MTKNEVKWAFYPIKLNDVYAGIFTAIKPDATEYDMIAQYENMLFDDVDNGKFVLIDKKQISGLSDDCRFMTTVIDNGRPWWNDLGYANPKLEMIKKADRVYEKEMNAHMV